MEYITNKPEYSITGMPMIEDFMKGVYELRNQMYEKTIQYSMRPPQGEYITGI